MQPKITVIAPEHFCTYIQALDNRYNMKLSKNYDLTYCPCERLAEMLPLYESMWESSDGFCVAGSFTKQMLLRSAKKVAKPVESISARSMEFYREFFFQLNQNRALDLNRVILDSYLWGGSAVPRTVEEFIRVDRLLVDIRQELLGHMSTEMILNTEQTVLARAQELWKAGEADLFLCRLATAYPLLQEAGFPCSFVYPAADTVLDTLQLIASHIALRRMADELPAAVCIRAGERKKELPDGLDMDSLDLQKAVLEFDREMTAGFVIRQIASGCEVYTTKQVIRRLTDEFHACGLRRFIAGHTNIPVSIGYGIGQTIADARSHAFEAEEISKRSGGSYLMTEDSSLIGPMDAKAVLNVSGTASEEILAAAKASGLSVSTIQRILSVTGLLGRSEMTTQELAASLKVTVANANRFLNALEKSGFAEVSSERRSYSKGRPSRIYRLKLSGS